MIQIPKLLLVPRAHLMPHISHLCSIFGTFSTACPVAGNDAATSPMARTPDSASPSRRTESPSRLTWLSTRHTKSSIWRWPRRRCKLLVLIGVDLVRSLRRVRRHVIWLVVCCHELAFPNARTCHGGTYQAEAARTAPFDMRDRARRGPA